MEGAQRDWVSSCSLPAAAAATEGVQMAKTIDLRTELPGTEVTEILARKERVIADAKSIYLPIVIDHAHGVRRHRRRRQHVPGLDRRHRLPERGAHQRGGVGRAARPGRPLPAHRLHDGAVRVLRRAGRAAARTRRPIAGPKKAAFFNSGAEAVENAVKIAKLATGRPAVIAFDRAFHGRTLMAMSLTSKQHPYKAGIGPFAPEVYRAPYPYPYRDDGGRSGRRRAGRAAGDVHHPRRGRAGGRDHLRAGAGRGRLRRAPGRVGARACARSPTQHGIVLIADEVQSGYGRTGKMFAIEHFGVEPDLITVAKSIAAGVPISGVIGRGGVMDARRTTHHRRHLRGLAARAAWPGIAVLDEIERRDLLGAAPRSASGCARGSRRCSCGTRASATCAAWARCWPLEFVDRPYLQGARVRSGDSRGARRRCAAGC